MHSHWEYDKTKVVCPLCKKEQNYAGAQFVYINKVEHQMCSECYSKLLNRANAILKRKYEDLAYTEALQALEKEYKEV